MIPRLTIGDKGDQLAENIYDTFGARRVREVVWGQGEPKDDWL